MAKKFEVTAKSVKSTKSTKSTKPAAAAKKVAKTDGESTERRTSLFRLKNDAKAVWSAFTGQKGEIIKAFEKLGAVGAKSKGTTRGALIAALPKISANNISFYLSKWQPAGVLEKLAAE